MVQNLPAVVMPVQQWDIFDDTSTDAFLCVEQNADCLHALAHLHAQLGTQAVAVIALRYGFQYNQKDIALVLDMPTDQVKNLCNLSLNLLRQQLRQT